MTTGLMASESMTGIANVPSDLLVRAAGIDDVGLLAAWAQAMALETEHKQLHADTVLAGVRAALEKPARGSYFIAEIIGVSPDVAARTAIGTLMFTHEWSDWRNGDWWWIQSVYVDPAHRRKGVYRALYDHVHALAQATPGVCGLRLYVERDNANAQRTYESLGMLDAGYRIYEDEFNA